MMSIVCCYVILWDIEQGIALRRWRNHTRPVYSVAFLDQHRVLSVAADNTIRIWRIDHTTQDLIAWVQEHRYIPSIT